MLSHVHIGVRDFDRALTFYNSLLPIAGWTSRFVDLERPWAGWQPEGANMPLFLVGVPFDENAANPGNGNMVAFQVGSPQIVDTFYDTAIANGATCQGKPGMRPEYHANYYGAYVRDLDGNKLCVCCHEAELAQISKSNTR
jgi:catechol 2,3-dioxygenase-like lactoylglutathione lyase family enzyme